MIPSLFHSVLPILSSVAHSVQLIQTLHDASSYSGTGLAGLLTAGVTGLLDPGVLRPGVLLPSGLAGLLELGVLRPGSLPQVCVLSLRMNPGLFSGVVAPLVTALPTPESGWTGSKILCILAAMSCSADMSFWSWLNVCCASLSKAG